MPSKRYKRSRCRNCKRLFYPDARNRGRQHYCGRSECRKASKDESNRKWKEKNPDYHKGPIHVARVQNWRKKNSDRPKSGKKTKNRDTALQDPLFNQPIEIKGYIERLLESALQDALQEQYLVITGIISQITNETLQDSIVLKQRRLRELGADILGSVTL